ncbi:D-ribose pyranase [Herbaspirillum sp. Sphag1AN]|uniref:D-ribose pyranase n=1 Tax=unclassified Herbaspirillum TaxID=2624150 RepID=UPI0016199B31|nr:MULTISPECIES: D-ribose pyranase [unclassified Herbaspirillum]MBB3211567.1 D-ribose pyranase [Herbaspirillum sp. Sphag1AN]MBB3245166.1 D-ribose pyranase [Herbaspirillum sp. Sphag64]
MKKTPLLHAALSQVIASLGHGESIVIGDAGLPVPPGVPLIDLALTRGIPGFMATLETILSEMQVEQYIVATELAERSPEIAQQIEQLGLPGQQALPHEQFKERTKLAKACIRTGEFTPYANIILIAGVVF